MLLLRSTAPRRFQSCANRSKSNSVLVGPRPTRLVFKAREPNQRWECMSTLLNDATRHAAGATLDIVKRCRFEPGGRHSGVFQPVVLGLRPRRSWVVFSPQAAFDAFERGA